MSTNKYYDHIKLYEIEELEFHIQTATKAVESIVKREDAVIVVGNTKVGKSALINYLMGNKLKGVKTKKTKLNLAKADDSFGPEISVDSVSKTDQPKRFKSEIFNIVFYDIPGFSDNRSKWQEIIHGVHTCELLKHLTSAKIILVISWDDLINDDVSLLLRSFNGLETLFGGKLRNCFASIGLIVSKVDESKLIDRQNISEILRDQLLSSDKLDLSPIVKDFIKYVANNSQKIGIFNRPCVEFVKIDDVESCIVSVINSIYRISEDTLIQVSPNISEASTAFLFKLREKLFDKEKFTKMENLVSSYLKKECVPNECIEIQAMHEARQFFENLTILKVKIEEYFTKWPRYCDKVSALEKFNQSIGDFINENDLDQKVKCIEIIDQLLKNEERRFLDIYLKRIFTEALKDIENNLVAVNVRLGNISEEEAKQKFELVLKRFQDNMESVKKDIEKLKEFVRLKKELQRRNMKDPKFPIYFRTQF